MAKKRNQMKCSYCGNYITLPGEQALPRLKEATKKEIARIGDQDLEALLTFDKEYIAKNMVEGFIWSLARAINKYRDTFKQNEKVEDNFVDDKSQLDLFQVAMVE